MASIWGQVKKKKKVWFISDLYFESSTHDLEEYPKYRVSRARQEKLARTNKTTASNCVLHRAVQISAVLLQRQYGHSLEGTSAPARPARTRGPTGTPIHLLAPLCQSSLEPKHHPNTNSLAI